MISMPVLFVNKQQQSCAHAVEYCVNTGWAKNSKPDNFCNNFVYCQPIFIIFGTCYKKFAMRRYIVSPRSRLYPCVCTFTAVIITNKKKAVGLL